jgi:hypothetical protein
LKVSITDELFQLTHKQYQKAEKGFDMAKWIVPICMISLISFTGCGNKKEETQKFRKEPPKLNDAPDELRNLKIDKPVKTEKKETKTDVSQHETELAELSVGELWKVYKQCRTDAEKEKEQGNFKESIALMLKGAEAAIKLEKPGIAAWQFNNAAKHAIDYFKSETGYSERMAKLTGMKHGDEKNAFRDESKLIMKDKFNILENAEKYLNSAKKYNEMENDPERVSAIESNMRFIKDIASFIE